MGNPWVARFRLDELPASRSLRQANGTHETPNKDALSPVWWTPSCPDPDLAQDPVNYRASPRPTNHILSKHGREAVVQRNCGQWSS